MLKSFSIGKEKYQLKVLYTELIIHFYIFLYRKFSPEFIYVSNSFLKKVRFVLNENQGRSVKMLGQDRDFCRTLKTTSSTFL